MVYAEVRHVRQGTTEITDEVCSCYLCFSWSLIVPACVSWRWGVMNARKEDFKMGGLASCLGHVVDVQTSRRQQGRIQIGTDELSRDPAAAVAASSPSKTCIRMDKACLGKRLWRSSIECDGVSLKGRWAVVAQFAAQKLASHDKAARCRAM